MMPEKNYVQKDGFLEREEVLLLLSEIHKDPSLTQRQLSYRTKISLGKTNYLLNSLMEKGILKIIGFSQNNGKLRKMQYILTPKGMQEKLRITYHFLKKKEQEYNFIKEQWLRLNQEGTSIDTASGGSRKLYSQHEI